MSADLNVCLSISHGAKGAPRRQRRGRRRKLGQAEEL